VEVETPILHLIRPDQRVQGDIGLVIAHKPNEQTVDVLLRPLLNNDMSISRQYSAYVVAVLSICYAASDVENIPTSSSAAYDFLTPSRTLGSNRSSLVRRKFSANLNGLQLDASRFGFPLQLCMRFIVLFILCKLSYELNAAGFVYDVQPYKSMRFVGPFELRTVKTTQVTYAAASRVHVSDDAEDTQTLLSDLSQRRANNHPNV
jgi:hypothetical protein